MMPDGPRPTSVLWGSSAANASHAARQPSSLLG